MPDILTSAEVEELVRDWPKDTSRHRAGITIIAGYQALADSPCPVCYGYSDEGTGAPDDAYAPCPHCGDFERRGRYAETWQDALDRLGKKKP